MKIKQREVHFLGGPLDGVRTHRFGEELREMGRFWVTASAGSYQANGMVITGVKPGEAGDVEITDTYDEWIWIND